MWFCYILIPFNKCFSDCIHVFANILQFGSEERGEWIYIYFNCAYLVVFFSSDTSRVVDSYVYHLFLHSLKAELWYPFEINCESGVHVE